MGHVRLGELPRTRYWDEVVSLIEEDRDAAEIAAATLKAAEKGFEKASKDPGLGYALWLLTQLPLAAREPDYVGKLEELGLKFDSEPNLTELLGGFTEAVDSFVRRHGGRSDIGEMAEMAATEALTSILGDRTKSLFGISTAVVKLELGKLATVVQFGALSRDFFARLTRRFLTFYVSRELSNHIGGDRRFDNIDAHSEFNEALSTHCQQAALIVERYSGEWYSKAKWEQRVTSQEVGKFAWYALKKMRTELRHGAARQ